MKRSCMGLLAALLMAMFYTSGLVEAWEFSTTASLRWFGQYGNQLGPNGFFGRYGMDNSSTGDYASTNGWLGAKLNDLVSGSAAGRQKMETHFYPEFRINTAARLRGKYRIADYDDPSASSYLNSTRPGVDVAISEGQWTLWWLSVQTPWGIVAYGKRPFTFGCGLQYNGQEDYTSESLLVTALYGPLRVGFGWYPWRQQPDNPFRRPASAAYQNVIGAKYDYPAAKTPYYNAFDMNGALAVSPSFFITYDSGSLSTGVLAEYYTFGAGAESRRSQAEAAAFPAYDTASLDGGAYVKYNNGRYFVNTEVDWIYSTTRYEASLDGTFNGTPPTRPNGTRSLFAPRYVEAWRCMAETGFVTGPVKTSFLYARLPGPDRRHGVLIDRQPYFYGFGNYGVFGPYSMVLNFYYGAGLDLMNLNGDGYMNDASVFGLRVDYAVASNLNAACSVFYAERVSPHGYGWGFIRPAPPVNGSAIQLTNFETVNAATFDAPSIPDGDLGWECDLAADWKLLEGWTLRMQGGLWFPGKWFNYACVDRSVSNWDKPAASNVFGVRPNRTIDPVLGLVFNVVADL